MRLLLAIVAVLGLVSAVVFQAAFRAPPPPPSNSFEFEDRVERLFAAKEAQALKFAKSDGRPQAPEVWPFFEAGIRGNWQRVDALYTSMSARSYAFENATLDDRLKSPVWQTVNESFHAYKQCVNGDPHYIRLFSDSIMKVVPRGSIYFGGTEAGRWLPTLFSDSHEKGRPFYVLTQNQLADGLYLQYLSAMYGGFIKIPSVKDVGAAFDNYFADAVQRHQTGRLRQGEIVNPTNDGRWQITGPAVVAAVNGLVAKTVFELNTNRDCYIEESVPFEWMHPRLVPFGAIMKIERKPLANLGEEAIRKDHAFWGRICRQTIGDWIGYDTPVSDVCDFVDRVHRRVEFSALTKFHYDPRYIQDKSAQVEFGKLRNAIANSIYAWRAAQSDSPETRAQMSKEAELALKQAFALCPRNGEIAANLSNLLIANGLSKDARLVTKTYSEFDDGDHRN